MKLRIKIWNSIMSNRIRGNINSNRWKMNKLKLYNNRKIIHNLTR